MILQVANLQIAFVWLITGGLPTHLAIRQRGWPFHAKGRSVGISYASPSTSLRGRKRVPIRCELGQGLTFGERQGAIEIYDIYNVYIYILYLIYIYIYDR